ncbi:MAG: alanine racemase [Helicobacteraceae bacterium]|nr:alanine racemase [Helicobacteraceae bacterium]
MAYITLNKTHFYNNLDIIARKTKTKDKIALVLKDNAYGHGLIEMATLASEYGITKTVVQTQAEAQQIAEYFESVLTLAVIPTAPHPKIRYTINELTSIEKFPKNTKVHLKVDTGMHRNGIAPDELRSAFEKIIAQGLILEAVFTHHRSADELSSEWFWQKQNFASLKEEAKALAQEFHLAPLLFHSCNSAALMRESDFDEDMARVGIAAYGCMDLPPPLDVEGFKPVLSVYAKRNSSRLVKKGQRVGYGGLFESDKEQIVSNYDFGYGDGFFRCLSEKYITPEGKKLLGRISMDNSSFVAEDEELLIFDNASDVAKIVGTISYEILTSLKPELQRVII